MVADKTICMSQHTSMCENTSGCSLSYAWQHFSAHKCA